MTSEPIAEIKKSKPYKNVLLCNIIIAILCLASIFSYFIVPLQSTQLNLTINEDVLPEEYHDEFEEYFDDDEITIAYPMELSAANTLLLAVKPEKVLANYITDNLNGLIDCAHDPLYKALQIHVENELEKDFITRIDNKIQFEYGDTKLSSDQLKSIRQYANITNKFVEKKVDNLMKASFEDEVSKEEIIHLARLYFTEAFQMLKNCGDPQLINTTFTESNEESIKNYIEIFYYEDESLVEQFSNTRRAKASVKDILGNTKDFEKTLKETFKESDGLSAAVSIGTKAIAGIFLLAVLSWIYVLIKVLVKFGCANNGVKLKAPIVFSFFPPLFFVFLPTLAFILMKNTLLSLIPESFEAFTILAEGFKVNFTSSAWIPLIIAIAFVIFTICFYGKQRNLVKKLVKGNDTLTDVKEEDYISMEVTEDEIAAVEQETNFDEETVVAEPETSATVAEETPAEEPTPVVEEAPAEEPATVAEETPAEEPATDTENSEE